jgi:hypothetical protein
MFATVGSGSLAGVCLPGAIAVRAKSARLDR